MLCMCTKYLIITCVASFSQHLKHISDKFGNFSSLRCDVQMGDGPSCVCVYVTDWKFRISERMFELRRLNLPVIKNKHHMMDGSRKKIFPSPSSFFFGASGASYPGVTLNRFDLQFRRVMCLLKVSSVRTGIKAEPRRGGTPGSVSQPRLPADARTYRSHLAPKEAIFFFDHTNQAGDGPRV